MLSTFYRTAVPSLSYTKIILVMAENTKKRSCTISFNPMTFQIFSIRTKRNGSQLVVLWRYATPEKGVKIKTQKQL